MGEESRAGGQVEHFLSDALLPDLVEAQRQLLDQSLRVLARSVQGLVARRLLSGRRLDDRRVQLCGNLVFQGCRVNLVWVSVDDWRGPGKRRFVTHLRLRR